MTRPRPSTFKALKNDYACFLLAIGGPIALAIALFTLVSGVLPRTDGGAQPVDPAFARLALAVAAVVSVAMGGMLLARLGRLRRTLTTGRVVEATIRDVWFMSDRGRIELEYEVDGRPHAAGRAVMKSGETERLKKGQRLQVIVDPARPDDPLPVMLFCA
jgi:hypothetical protein